MLWFPALPSLRHANCRATAQSVRQGAAFLVVDGVMNSAYQVWLRDVLRRLIATHGTLELFVDARQVHGYKPPQRAEDAELLLSLSDKITRVHVLVRSRLLALSLSVADLTLSGSVSAYAKLTKFHAVLAPESLPQAAGF
jgi:hypothetical protein